MRGLGRPQLQALFARVEGFAELDIDALVPRGTPDYTPVRHFGQNSLPAFTHFEKRFYRMADAAAVGGANFQTFAPLTGPGYFVVKPAEGEREGEMAIDYNHIPKLKAGGWPAITDNDSSSGRK